MFKKFSLMLLVLALFACMTGCGKTKVLHCDNCKKEVEVEESSNMEEDWILYCEECNEELFGDNPIFDEYDN